MKRVAVGFVMAMVLSGCGGGDTPAEGLLEDTGGGGGDDTSNGELDTGDPFVLDTSTDDTGGGGDDASADGAGDTGPFDALIFDAPGDTTCATSEVAAPKPPVDIIMVIDQSGSMQDDIVRVRNNVNKLSDYLTASGLDYRLVMIARAGACASTATSCTNVCTPPPLGGPVVDCADTTKPLRNSNPPIYRTSNQVIGSTDALRKILDTYDSTTAGIGWRDALRPNAFKAIIPITDDDSRGTSGMTAAAFDTQLLGKAPAGMFGTSAARKYAAYPIMGASAHPSETICGSTMVNNGPQYINLVKLTGGKWFPLCATDFGPVFTDIAKSIASAVACEVAVPPPPAGEVFDPGKVNVLYTPSSGGSVPITRDESKACASGANGWQYASDGKKILLCGTACSGLKADPGGKISVQFGCAGKGPPPPPDAGMCIGLGAPCGDAGACCSPLACLPGPEGTNICRVKGPA